MRKTILFVVLFVISCAPIWGDYYVAGDFNDWNPAGSVMNDVGGGIWQVSLANVPGRHEFLITVGDWSQFWPGSGNSWFFGDASGNVTITFNANETLDGWVGSWGRIGLSTDPGTWTAVGDFNEWNNVANVMVPQGGGVYKFQQILVPGWYMYKAVITGSWDAIGNDFRGVNADPIWFEMTAEKPVASFWVNARTGVIKVEAQYPPPVEVTNLRLSATVLQVDKMPGATHYVVYEQDLGTWYGSPTRTCLAEGTGWVDNGDGTVTLSRAASADKWIVVSAANSAGESSAGRDSYGNERNASPGWPPPGACAP